MKRLVPPALRLLAALTIVGLPSMPTARAQLPTAEERLKVLTDPESLKAKAKGEKDKSRPPLEFFRSQIAPFDILPYVKPNHWSTLSLEMRANYEDYQGVLQTSPVRLMGMSPVRMAISEAPQEVVYRREARLLKEQRARLGIQFMLPRIPKEIALELTRPEAIRVDEIWQASLRVLEPHQALILILTRDSTDPYARWSHLQAMVPMGTDRNDPQALDRQRYYRMVVPMDADNLPLSSHPLTWTTLSHVIWDGFTPETLSPAHQQAMLDWLHWGGQLVVVGGAKPSFAALRDSFLASYLPADPSGENALLTESDLSPLSKAYRPLLPNLGRDDPQPIPNVGDESSSGQGFYLAPEPIRPATNRPVFLAGLKPRAGASLISLGEQGGRLLGAECRVGRGRILMLAVNPTDPALIAWPGLDTMVRRLVLRRPEEALVSPGGWNGQEMRPPSFLPLSGADLTWFRVLSRDLGTTAATTGSPAAPTGPVATGPEATARSLAATPPTIYTPETPSVAEWADSSALPRMSRDALEQASGISIPSPTFVLKVILAYVIALVPLNWLICRYLLGRREWAWVVVPVLSLGFAVGVERAAAYDMGYDAACDEIDVLETYGGYPRAHLSRFASLYTTGRVQFAISFPNDPTALALPMDNGRSLRGEDIMTSRWQSQPIPTLEAFQVQPRSLSLFRSEQMVNLSGAVAFESDDEGRRVVNTSDLELRDAVLVDVNGPGDRRETYLGTIGPGATVDVRPAARPKAGPAPRGRLDPAPFLGEFRAYAEDRPEDRGEIRLVAWVDRVMGGVKLEPEVDRHRGFTAVVVHLRSGPPPAPEGPRYDLLAREGALARPVPPPALELPPPGRRRPPMRVVPPKGVRRPAR